MILSPANLWAFSTRRPFGASIQKHHAGSFKQTFGNPHSSVRNPPVSGRRQPSPRSHRVGGSRSSWLPILSDSNRGFESITYHHFFSASLAAIPFRLSGGCAMLPP